MVSADAASVSAARMDALAAGLLRLKEMTAAQGEPDLIQVVPLGPDRYRCFIQMSCAEP